MKRDRHGGIGNFVFCGASYVSALPKRWPPLMLSHSGGGDFFKD